MIFNLFKKIIIMEHNLDGYNFCILHFFLFFMYLILSIYLNYLNYLQKFKDSIRKNVFFWIL